MGKTTRASRGIFKFVIVERGAEITAKMVAPVSGIEASALCSTEDEFNFGFGLNLAMERAIKHYQGKALERLYKVEHNIVSAVDEALASIARRKKEA